jgi:hypothetical protein
MTVMTVMSVMTVFSRIHVSAVSAEIGAAPVCSSTILHGVRADS